MILPARDLPAEKPLRMIWDEALSRIKIAATRELLRQKTLPVSVILSSENLTVCSVEILNTALFSVVRRKESDLAEAISSVLDIPTQVSWASSLQSRPQPSPEPPTAYLPSASTNKSPDPLDAESLDWDDIDPDTNPNVIPEQIFNLPQVWQHVLSFLSNKSLRALYDMRYRLVFLSVEKSLAVVCFESAKASDKQRNNRYKREARKLLPPCFYRLFGCPISVEVMEPAEWLSFSGSKGKSTDSTQPATPRPPVYSADSTDDFIEWHGLYCRSQPEQSIAQELEKRGLSFLVNAGGRFNLNGDRVTREPDFLVFLGNGKSAILEVDGESFHQSAAKDHNRDRMFRKLGVQVERFPATECMADPDRVVAEFLEVVTK